MFLFRLAVRNLFRQLSRNAVSMVSIVLGVFIIVLGRGFTAGMAENMKRAQIDSVSGHVTAVPPEYPDAGLRHPIDQAYALDAQDRSFLAENTTAWTGRVIAAPRLIFQQDAMRVRMIAYDPATDGSVFPRTGWSVDGSLADDVPGGVAVGVGIAELLDLKVGSPIVLENRTVDGAMNAVRFEVTGIVRTGMPMLDMISVMVPMGTAEDLIQAGGRVTHVSARGFRRDAAPQLAEAMNAQLGERAVATDWLTEIGPLLQSQAIRDYMLGIISFALLAMAAAGIANTILMAAFERTREIGTLRALGLKRGGVITLFAFEGLGLGLVGGVVGVAGAAALTYYWSTSGIDISGALEGRTEMASLPMTLMIYTDFSPATIAAAVVIAILVAVLASLYPALVASRMLPADAVRAE
ncbi:MAG: ABC transporter permease [Myxococcota bacterium]